MKLKCKQCQKIYETNSLNDLLCPSCNHTVFTEAKAQPHSVPKKRMKKTRKKKSTTDPQPKSKTPVAETKPVEIDEALDEEFKTRRLTFDKIEADHKAWKKDFQKRATLSYKLKKKFTTFSVAYTPPKVSETGIDKLFEEKKWEFPMNETKELDLGEVFEFYKAHNAKMPYRMVPSTKNYDVAIAKITEAKLQVPMTPEKFEVRKAKGLK